MDDKLITWNHHPSIPMEAHDHAHQHHHLPPPLPPPPPPPPLHDQLPFANLSWHSSLLPPRIMNPTCFNVASNHHEENLLPREQEDQDQDQGEEEDEEEENEEELGAMKEMMYKIAAMQPVDIDPATIRKPKRRNVRISDDPQSVAARHRRERISEKIRILQRLVPGGTKMDTASMLEEATRYVKFLKRQVRQLQSSNDYLCRGPPPFAEWWPTSLLEGGKVMGSASTLTSPSVQGGGHGTEGFISVESSNGGDQVPLIYPSNSSANYHD